MVIIKQESLLGISLNPKNPLILSLSGCIRGEKTQIGVIFRVFGIKGNRQKYHLDIPLFIMLRLKDMMAILLTI
jgi:hypothetical protein